MTVSRSLLKFLRNNASLVSSSTKRKFSSSSALFFYSRTEVTIPVPITGGHLAAQLWEQAGSNQSGSSPKTPIICMHGYQDNSCSFDPLIPLIIKDGMKIVAVDFPGHGLSSHLTGSGKDFVLDGVATVARVIRHFSWDKVILLGHSYGSIISFMFSAAFPEKVEKYIGIDNVHDVPSGDPSKQLQRICKKLFEVEEKLTNPNKAQPTYTLEDMVKRTTKARKGTVTEEGIRTLLKRGAIQDPTNPDLYKFTHDLKTDIPSKYGRVHYDQSLETARTIQCPVCIIKGDPGNDYEPREKFMKVIDAIRASIGDRLEFHLVPGTHHLHLNDPICVAPIISRFLNA